MRSRLALIAAALFSTAALAALAPSCGGGPDDPNADKDGDGFPLRDDCDDEDDEVNPDVSEEPCACNLKDDDCNGKVDDLPCPLKCAPSNDADGDGYEPPEDCNDQDPAINPGAAEPCECDAIDQNCNKKSQDFSCDKVCHFDKDNDGFNDSMDCNDNDGNIRPDAQEPCECDAIDQNCNNNPLDFPADCMQTCTDADGDQVFAESGDCDDSNKDINPNATEPCACDAVDQDCNNTADDFDASCMKMCTYLNKGDACTAGGMEPVCGPGLACCGATPTCVDKCTGAMCAGDCPM